MEEQDLMPIRDTDHSSTEDQFDLYGDIAGFWPRLIAYFLDSLLLGIVGFAAGRVMVDELASLGSWGRLIGFMIVVIYFGVLNSRMGGGQTLGKRIMKIRVVDGDGQTLTVNRSILRIIVLAAPFMLPSGIYGSSGLGNVLFMGLAIISTVAGITIVYLYLFNSKTRQSLHDLLLGTFVVKAKHIGLMEPLPVPRKHYAIIAGICVLFLIVAIIPRWFIPVNWEKLGALQQQWSNRRDVSGAGFLEGFMSSPQGTSHYTTATIYMKQKPASYEQLATQAAGDILNQYRDGGSIDRIGITIIYGYDIGISNATITYQYFLTPDDWKKVLNGQKVLTASGSSTHLGI